MSETPHAPQPMPRGPTAAQLRGDIDSGRTHDKVAGVDPAASPLGTDEEAGGAPQDPQVIAADRAALPDSRERAPNAATPELTPDARLRTNLLGPILIGVAAALVLAWVLFQLL